MFCSARRLIATFRQPLASLTRERRAGVALMTCLMAPFLIAITGLSLDVGYWYEQQESLQSAADAASLAAANAALAYNTSTSSVASFTSTTGGNFAVEAANLATKNRFGFASSGAATVSVSATAGTSSVTFMATATIPRGDFFSPVRGMGLAGVVAGTQSASAQAAYAVSSFSPCGYFSTTINEANGGGKIDATNCALYAGSTTGPSITSSSQIIGVAGVDTPARACPPPAGATSAPIPAAATPTTSRP